MDKTSNDYIGPVSAGEVVKDARLANALRIAYTGYEPAVTPSVPASEGVEATSLKLEYDENIATTVSTNIVKPEVYDADTRQYGTWNGAAQTYYNAISDVALKETTEYAEWSENAANGTYTIDAEDYDETNKYYTVALVKLQGNKIDGYYGRVTLTIWLEGYDADCFNAILNDSADITLAFKGIARN